MGLSIKKCPSHYCFTIVSSLINLYPLLFTCYINLYYVFPPSFYLLLISLRVGLFHIRGKRFLSYLFQFFFQLNFYFLHTYLIEVLSIYFFAFSSRFKVTRAIRVVLMTFDFTKTALVRQNHVRRKNQEGH